MKHTHTHTLINIYEKKKEEEEEEEENRRNERNKKIINLIERKAKTHPRSF